MHCNTKQPFSHALTLSRSFANGETCSVGTLKRDRSEIFFRYVDSYLHSPRGKNLSPLKLSLETIEQCGPISPNRGLHGVFADSLPDGWGMLLLDRICQQERFRLCDLTQSELLSWIGDRAVGAITYNGSCALPPPKANGNQIVNLCDLGQAASCVFEGGNSPLLGKLVISSAVGGACPKALLYFSENFQTCSLLPQNGFSAWIVKFSSPSLPFGHESGILEAAALSTAQAAGIRVNEYRLFGGKQEKNIPNSPYWLGVRRFDRTPIGKLHYVSVAGLLDANYRLPCLDYEDLIRLTALLTKSQEDTQEMFRRALFNFFIGNCDDHAKNFGFLMDDDGQWHLSPAFDITYSPNIYGEYATSFAGCGKTLTSESIQKLGLKAVRKNMLKPT